MGLLTDINSVEQGSVSGGNLGSKVGDTDGEYNSGAANGTGVIISTDLNRVDEAQVSVDGGTNAPGGATGVVTAEVNSEGFTGTLASNEFVVRLYDTGADGEVSDNADISNLTFNYTASQQ